MEEFKKLMELVWSLGKFFFTSGSNTLEAYSKFTEYGNNLLKPYKQGTKEYIFLKSMIIALNDFCDATWYENNKISS